MSHLILRFIHKTGRYFKETTLDNSVEYIFKQNVKPKVIFLCWTNYVCFTYETLR